MRSVYRSNNIATNYINTDSNNSGNDNPDTRPIGKVRGINGICTEERGEELYIGLSLRNMGNGEHIYDDNHFKTVLGGEGVNVKSSPSEIIISSSMDNNNSGGTKILKDGKMKTLKSSGIKIVDGDDILLKLDVNNTGNGKRIITMDDGVIEARSLISGSGITMSEHGGDIIITGEVISNHPSSGCLIYDGSVYPQRLRGISTQIL
jgi:hypothetical protein